MDEWFIDVCRWVVMNGWVMAVWMGALWVWVCHGWVCMNGYGQVCMVHNGCVGLVGS